MMHRETLPSNTVYPVPSPHLSPNQITSYQFPLCLSRVSLCMCRQLHTDMPCAFFNQQWEIFPSPFKGASFLFAAALKIHTLIFLTSSPSDRHFGCLRLYIMLQQVILNVCHSLQIFEFHAPSPWYARCLWDSASTFPSELQLPLCPFT